MVQGWERIRSFGRSQAVFDLFENMALAPSPQRSPKHLVPFVVAGCHELPSEGQEALQGEGVQTERPSTGLDAAD